MRFAWFPTALSWLAGSWWHVTRVGSHARCAIGARRCKAERAKDAFAELEVARKFIIESIQAEARRKEGQAALERERVRKQQQQPSQEEREARIPPPPAPVLNTTAAGWGAGCV